MWLTAVLLRIVGGSTGEGGCDRAPQGGPAGPEHHSGAGEDLLLPSPLHPHEDREGNHRDPGASAAMNCVSVAPYPVSGGSFQFTTYLDAILCYPV